MTALQGIVNPPAKTREAIEGKHAAAMLEQGSKKQA